MPYGESFVSEGIWFVHNRCCDCTVCDVTACSPILVALRPNEVKSQSTAAQTTLERFVELFDSSSANGKYLFSTAFMKENPELQEVSQGVKDWLLEV